MNELVPVPFSVDYWVSADGEVWSSKQGQPRVLKTWPNNKGYQIVHLRAGGRTVKLMVHRMVAALFVPGLDRGLEVRHKNDMPLDCRADNLEWGTHKDNMQDMSTRRRHGSVTKPHRVPRGERHRSVTSPESVSRGELNGVAKITERTVVEIRRLYSETGNISEVARRLGIPRGATKCVVQGKTWRHVKEAA